MTDATKRSRTRRFSQYLVCLVLVAVCAFGCAEAKSGNQSDGGDDTTSILDGMGDGTLDTSVDDDATTGDATTVDLTIDDVTDGEVDMFVPPPTPTGPAVSATGGGGAATSSTHRLKMAVGTPPFAIATSADHRLVLGPVPR